MRGGALGRGSNSFLQSITCSAFKTFPDETEVTLKIDNACFHIEHHKCLFTEVTVAVAVTQAYFLFPFSLKGDSCLTFSPLQVFFIFFLLSLECASCWTGLESA